MFQTFRLLFLLSLFLFSSLIKAQSFVRIEGTKLIVADKESTFVGINLENNVWCTPTNLISTTLALSLKQIKEIGFEAVRVKVSEKNIECVPLLMRQAEKHNIRVILCLVLSQWERVEDFKISLLQLEKTTGIMTSSVLLAWEVLVGHDYHEEVEYVKMLRNFDSNHLIGVVTLNSKEDVEWDYIEEIGMLSDYFCISLLPLERKWTSLDRTYDALPNVYLRTEEYLEKYSRMAVKYEKPLVIVECSYPRDRNMIEPGSPTDSRLSFFQYVLGKMMRGNSYLSITFFSSFSSRFEEEEREERLRTKIYLEDRDFLEMLTKSLEKLHY